MPEQNILSIIALVVSIAAILVSVYNARKYGDVAGAKEIIEHEKAKADEARVSALQSLVNEVERIRKLAEHNSQLDPNQKSQPTARMPVSAFETAFVSGMLVSMVSQELLDVVSDYLACADSINTLVDVYVAGTPSGEGKAEERMHAAVVEIKRICTDELPLILKRLSDALQRELEAMRQELR